MKIGILLCDDFYPEAIEKFGQHDDAFKNLLNTLADAQFQTWRCHLGDFPKSPEQCDLWVVSGSKWSAYEEYEWIRQLMLFIGNIEASKKRLLGICFGHQIIHQALGGNVNRSSKGWGLGLYPVHIHENFQNLKSGNKISVIAMHQDQVEITAPDFTTIAGSEFCPNAITSRDGQILTIQAHPEFEPDFFIQLCEHVRENAGDEHVEFAQHQVSSQRDGDRKKLKTTISEFFSK